MDGILKSFLDVEMSEGKIKKEEILNLSMTGDNSTEKISKKYNNKNNYSKEKFETSGLGIMNGSP